MYSSDENSDDWGEDEVTDSYSPDDSGEYDITATARGGDEIDDSEASFEGFIFDIDNPDFELVYPDDGQFIDTESPTLEVDFEDQLSGLANASIDFDEETVYLEDSDVGDSTSTLTLDIDTGGEGDFSFDVWAEDRAGNSFESDPETISFSVDTTSPDPDSYSLDPSEGLYDVEFGDDFGIEIEVEPSQDHESRIEAVCYVNGDEEDSDGTNSFSEGDEVFFDCDIPDDYMDQTVDFEFDLVDEAGNSWSSDTYFYELDASDPVVEVFEPLVNVSVFNDDFDMEFLAVDDVAGVDSVEYHFDSDTDEGDGFSVDEDDSEFTVDTSEIDSEGDTTVYLRAKDNLDKWGSSESFEFDYLPDANPELSMTADESVEVTSGETVDFEIVLENTGDIVVSEGEVTGSESFIESGEYGEMVPGDSETVVLQISPENDLGESNVTFEASTADASVEVELLVRADDEQQEEIESEVEQISNEYSDLESRFEDMRNSFNEDRESRVDSEVEEFEASFDEAQQAIEEGRYYEADQILEGLASSLQSAESTFEEVKDEHETAMRNRYIIAGLFFLLLLAGGGAGFVLYSDGNELDIDSLKDMDIGSSESEDDDGYSHSDEEEEISAIDRIRGRVEDLRGSEEDDEPDYEFK